jgi:hypothetical protein
MNSGATTQQRIAVPTDLAGLARSVSSWLETNITQALFSALFGAILGYATNFLLLAFWYDGYQKSAGGIATGQGNIIAGSLFWMLASTILFTLVGYRRAIGKERFWREVRSLPATLGNLFREDGRAARIHLLWGAAISLIASQLISPCLAGVVAVGLLAAAPSLVGRIVSALLYRAWSLLVRRFAPTRGRPLNGPISMTVAIMGSAVALGIAFFVDAQIYRLGMAALCGVVAWRLASGHKPIVISTTIPPSFIPRASRRSRIRRCSNA